MQTAQPHFQFIYCILPVTMVTYIPPTPPQVYLCLFPLFVCLATDQYYRGCHIRFVWFLFLSDDSIVILMFTLTNDGWNRYIELRKVFIQTSNRVVVVVVVVIIEILLWLLTCLDPIGSSVCQYWRWSSGIGGWVETIGVFNEFIWEQFFFLK